jgi:hypothetical protein
VRILVIQRPTLDCIDGMRLDRFEPGQQYDLGVSLAALFLAERWAEPVNAEPPRFAVQFDELNESAQAPPNLVRDIFPPYYDGPAAFAADRRRRHRAKPRIS